MFINVNMYTITIQFPTESYLLETHYLTQKCNFFRSDTTGENIDFRSGGTINATDGNTAADSQCMRALSHKVCVMLLSLMVAFARHYCDLYLCSGMTFVHWRICLSSTTQRIKCLGLHEHDTHSVYVSTHP